MSKIVKKLEEGKGLGVRQYINRMADMTRKMKWRANLYAFIGIVLMGGGLYYGLRNYTASNEGAENLERSEPVVAIYSKADKLLEAVKERTAHSLCNKLSLLGGKYSLEVKDSLEGVLYEEDKLDARLRRVEINLNLYLKDLEKDTNVQEYIALRKLSIKPYVLPVAGGALVFTLALSMKGASLGNFYSKIRKISKKKTI